MPPPPTTTTTPPSHHQTPTPANHVSPTSLYIGGGQFGQIYTTSQSPTTAFKIVRNAANTHKLIAEHASLSKIYPLPTVKPPVFLEPRPIGLCVPTLKDHKEEEGEEEEKEEGNKPRLFTTLNPTRATYAMARIPSLARVYSDALLSQSNLMINNSNNTTNVDVQQIHEHEPITMCRLYFGKTQPQTQTHNESSITTRRWTSRFINSRNFPIDLQTYETLREKFCRDTDISDLLADSRGGGPPLPSPAEIAKGMGQMVAKIHKAGYDCRDVEFVLAGNCLDQNHDHDHDQDDDDRASLFQTAGLAHNTPTDTAAQPQPQRPPAHANQNPNPNPNWGLHAFDFDQLNPLPCTSNSTSNPTSTSPSPTSEQINLLRTAFFLNDPYFPRPRPGCELYEAFKRGYWEEASCVRDEEGLEDLDMEGREKAVGFLGFLREIERWQAGLDAVV